ncbi:hypothetical protein A3715_17085 [Oleiphilus sp. HI0009]|uniref:SDR family NAD(P)-dependent oxidoreductase n=1 Tax=unclassified Oleiphilus TaxID=2631174 RepID=UPI0007C32701|nr:MULTISPECIES: SDR family NAD(P)-dependent oxidoreductase [unclassified Oleiphilus]KZX85526.1 hypothetical protein A3715_17085 [Oleiphilus sp. HI0009]KZY61297.1 hypothetical protein A3738_14130 [Oleiphilus sp. HI0066]KZY72232.1 hypothetical protein A3739_15760 [Oleiphilus sp. HI0067]
MKRIAVVIGASGGIGGACVEHCCADANYVSVIAVSRSNAALSFSENSKLTILEADSSKPSMANVVTEVLMQAKRVASLDVDIIIATGLLHTETGSIKVQPEKRIEALDMQSALTVLETNTLMPMLWLQAFSPLFALKLDTRVLVLSARVGSIGDNRLGGWYSYRSSKAALNMMLKTASTEYARRYPNVKLIAYHPGTTDTGLSKPFQANVPEGKLFSQDYSAERLIDVMQSQAIDKTLSFVDWQGKSIEW